MYYYYYRDYESEIGNNGGDSGRSNSSGGGGEFYHDSSDESYGGNNNNSGGGGNNNSGGGGGGSGSGGDGSSLPDYKAGMCGGWLFASLAGSGLHFAYHASGCAWFVGWLVAVNESVYEHLKLLIFPLLVWWLIVVPIYLRIDYSKKATFTRTATSALAAACASILCGTSFITLIYLASHYVLGVEALWFDIATFVVAAALSQYAGWRTLHVFYHAMSDYDISFWRIFVIPLFLGLMGMYLTFTDFPPHSPAFIFRDTSSRVAAKNSTANESEALFFYGRPAVCRS